MRDFKGMKRQRGRNRGSGGGSGGGKPQQQNANRAFDSNGPEGVKVRGNAQHVFEKYQQLARDASSAGDRVLAENYLQHAEHYFRVVRAIQPSRPASDIIGRETFSGYDIDFEDESGQQAAEAEAAAAATAESEPTEGEGETRERVVWQRDERPRDERPREDRPREDRYRDDRPRDERPRDERPRNENRRDRWQRDDRPRDDRPREDRPREDRPRDERPRDERPREDRPRDPLPVVEPQAAPLTLSEGRASPVLRDSDGGESHAPAFLQVRPAAAPAATDEEKPAARPRRRRAPRTFEGGEGETPPASETEEA